MMNKYTSFYSYPNFTIDDSLKLGTYTELPADAERMRELIYSFVSEGGWELRVSVDGLIQFSTESIESEVQEINEAWEKDMFHAKSFDSVWLQYLDICNAIYFCFECSMHSGDVNLYGFEFQSLTYAEITRVTYDENDIPIKQASYTGGGINKLIRYGEYYPKEIKKIVIHSKCMDYLAGYYLENVLADPLILSVVVKTGQSLSDHNKTNWSSSIVTSWFVVEWYIGTLWDDFLRQNNIAGQRKKLLVSRDYTASIVIEHLQLHGIIDIDLYERITRLRKLRNKIAHEFIGVELTKEDSIAGLELCKWVLSNTSGLDFPFSAQGLAVHGM